MFFTNAKSEAYNDQPKVDATGSTPAIQIPNLNGNMTRVCYMLARNGDEQKASQQQSVMAFQQ